MWKGRECYIAVLLLVRFFPTKAFTYLWAYPFLNLKLCAFSSSLCYLPCYPKLSLLRFITCASDSSDLQIQLQFLSSTVLTLVLESYRGQFEPRTPLLTICANLGKLFNLAKFPVSGNDTHTWWSWCEYRRRNPHQVLSTVPEKP